MSSFIVVQVIRAMLGSVKTETSWVCSTNLLRSSAPCVFTDGPPPTWRLKSRHQVRISRQNVLLCGWEIKPGFKSSLNSSVVLTLVKVWRMSRGAVVNEKTVGLHVSAGKKHFSLMWHLVFSRYYKRAGHWEKYERKCCNWPFFHQWNKGSSYSNIYYILTCHSCSSSAPDTWTLTWSGQNTPNSSH